MGLVTNRLLIISLFCLATELPSDAHSYQTKNTIIRTDLIRIQKREIFVSLSGDNSLGDGTREKPYKTIQWAIDNSINGDVIIVLPGRYFGSGNTNLDTKGKEVEIRSDNPLDSICLNNTIIDAEGQGLIMRCINNEKQTTILNGFSLVSGDTSSIITKGIQGFFEFSMKANPSIRNIKIVGKTKFTKSSLSSKIQSLSSGNIINPYFHPVGTTDYYGSGDANKDGAIDLSDWNLINRVINGEAPSNIRCDIDGNGQIADNDATILLNLLNNDEILPSSWNYLNTAQKNDWLDKMIINDKTNENIYYIYFYQCLNYAREFCSHFNHFLSDRNVEGHFPLNVVYNGGQTIYNIPVYKAIITAPGFGHAINAVLVGENPLDFYDWRFIEPQTDEAVYPGFWDMPFNSEIAICLYENPSAEEWEVNRFLTFHADEQTTTVKDYNTGLLLSAPSPTVMIPNNSDYEWYPSIIVSDTTYILYDQTRDDLSRISDIHIKNTNNWKDKPITLFEETSFLLDSYQESDSIIHLLFTSKLGKIPGVYYGRYNLKKDVLTETARISSDDARVVSCGKLIVSDNEIHAFWLLSSFSTFIPSPGGIYWNHRTSSTNWNSEALLYSVDYPVSSVKSDGPAIFPYLMDGVLLNNGYPLVVVQSLHFEGSLSSDLVFMNYSGSGWNIDSLKLPITVNRCIRDLDLLYDSNNVLHLVFTSPGNTSLITSSLCHIFSLDNGNTWSQISTIYSYSSYKYERVLCNPRLVSDGGRLVLTYLNREYPSEILWRIFENGEWLPARGFSLPEGNYPWFPQVAVLPSDDLLFVWSNSSEGKIELKSKIITPADCLIPGKAGVISGTTKVCRGQKYAIYSVPAITNATSYLWSLPYGSTGTSNTNSITVNYDSVAISGNITVQGINSCGEGTIANLEIEINSIPTGTGIISGDTNVCQGQKAVLYTVSEIVNATQYVWSLPIGETRILNSNKTAFNYGSRTKSGYVKVNGRNYCGDGPLFSLPVTVNPLPASAEVIYGDTSVCEGQDSVVYSVPEIANANTYVWSLPYGTIGSSDTNRITVEYSSSSESGDVTVSGANSCGSGNSAILSVEVKNKPVTPIITQNENFLHSDALVGNQWYDTNGIIINATDQNYSVTENGKYYLIVTQSGCSSDTSNIVHVNITGIQSIGERDIFNVYPNPASDILVIEINGNEERTNFEILNSNGQTVFEDYLTDKYILQTNSFAPGIYIIKFEHGETFEFRKMIKK